MASGRIRCSLKCCRNTSPQLGGNLDVNGNDIVTTSNADIDLDPNGSGVVVFKATLQKVLGSLS